MLQKISTLALAGVSLSASILFSVPAQAEDFEFFENRIRPVLVDNCYPCHSAASAKIKGGLRLDTKSDLLKGGDTGPAVVAGEPAKSLLIKAVRYTDPDLQMPPKGKRLADAQVADLVAWVKMGAPDPRVGPEKTAQKPLYDFPAARRQWAFHPPVDPPVPDVKTKRWAKSPIDNFILAKLEEKNLAPAAPADKRALIRRATFDLTGLPPTPQEVEAFLKDKSPGAFAKVVDRLLASPHYGERWGRHWLDVVRYTDSMDTRVTGTDGDSTEAYRYRDWVVNSFNQDLPYNQFIREQIAGDLLQPREADRIDTNAIIATGMYALGNWGNGDADKDKILTDIADDQVDVTGRAFLGLTMACARCHDHKFDPIPTADYYSLAGIFFSSHILPKLTPKGQGENLLFIPLASKSDLDHRQKREERLAELDKQIAPARDEQIARLGKLLLTQSADYLNATAAWKNQSAGGQSKKNPADFAPNLPLLSAWVNYLGFGDLKLLSRITRDFQGKPGLTLLHNARDADTPAGFINATDQPISFITITMPPHTVGIHPSPNAGVAAGWKSPMTGQVNIKGRVADADPNCGDGIEWKIQAQGETGVKEIASGAIPNGGAQDFKDGKDAENLQAVRINAGDFLSLVVLPKGDYSCDATVVELDLTDLGDAKRAWSLSKDVIADVNNGNNPYADSQGHDGVWALYDMDGQSALGDMPTNSPLAKWFSGLSRKENAATLSSYAEVVQRLLVSPGVTNSSLNKLYQDLTNSKSAFWAGASAVEQYFPEEARKNIQAEQSELAALRKNAPGPLAKTHGLEEGGVPESPHAGLHDVKIHLRGRYDHLGDLVPRRFPRLLAGDDQKPVTEGSGRLELANWVANPDNPLTARVMVNRIWQHHFGEGIVRTPNNYGKLGTPPTHPELLDYLAHRFIDSGWSIKAMHRAIMLSAVYQQSSIPQPATFKSDPDNLLFGRMNRRRLESEALRDSMLSADGKLDPAIGGPAIRDLNTLRRTLYVMTIRSDRATYQFLFDAADPNAIVEKRIDSTVAPQALFLMNNTFTLAQVKSLTARMMKEAPRNHRGRIKWLYQVLYGRPATKPEIQIGLGAVAHARASGGDSELAWEEYCQVLLCANEFIYVD